MTEVLGFEDVTSDVSSESHNFQEDTDSYSEDDLGDMMEKKLAEIEKFLG